MPRSNFLADSTNAGLFLDGIKRLKDPTKSPWPNQPGLSLYDVLVFWHHQSMMTMTPPGQNDRNAAHSGPAFLPWHRYFLLFTERLLQQVLGNPDFRMPYWDWASDAELPSPTTSPIWNMTNLGQFVGPSWEVRLAMNPITGQMQRVNRQLSRTVGAKERLPRRH
jgi:tyrosinase